jgi:DNA/RNA-binding domain of Phe-tRNA-synthetase-like protein
VGGTVSQRALTVLDDARVDEAVWQLRSDYAVLLMVAEGLTGGASDAAGEALLVQAEQVARARLAGGQPHDRPQVKHWREAYRGFGAKPQRTRNSLEALLRRVDDGLPRINRLTDIYNAVSVLHEIPLGGEDLDGYQGVPRLTRALGDEPFDTMAAGEGVVEHPEPGEVIWRDDAGVTCRRWNWRQCRRTALSDQTRRAVFILDGLGDVVPDGLLAAGDRLSAELEACYPGIGIAGRLVTRPAG